jgi:hypothetical protein
MTTSPERTRVLGSSSSTQEARSPPLSPLLRDGYGDEAPVRSRSAGKEDRVGAFAYKLEMRDGSSADPPSFRTAVLTWRPGDVIPLGGGRSLRVVETRSARDPDDDPVLVVESVR